MYMKGHEGTSRGDGDVCIERNLDDTDTCICQNSVNVHRLVNFIVCKFCIKRKNV